MKVVRSRDQSVSRVTDETLSLLGYLVGLGVLGTRVDLCSKQNSRIFYGEKPKRN